jgi:enoyl-CoA hydratase/carnithine racemase
MDQVILYEKIERVAILTLNRPDMINAFNVAMRDEMYELLRLTDEDPDCLVVVIRGAGDRGFCAGADLTEFGTAPSQVIAREVRWERDLWGLFQAHKKPLIASLHGHVIGSGVEIASLCDIRIAADNCKFRMPEVALGMIPAAGGSQSISRLAGSSIALDMLLTNRVFTSDHARKIGLVDRVVSPGELNSSTIELAMRIKGFDVELLGSIKQMVRLGVNMNLPAALKFEKRVARSLSVALS